MLRGIYTAANTMELSVQKMNQFAENVSNAQTYGYKKKTVGTHSFGDVMVQMSDGKTTAPLAVGAYLTNAGVNQSQGVLRSTNNPLDVAIRGEKVYFQVEVNDPNKAAPRTYHITRNGHFQVNRFSELVTREGDYVLDVNNQRIRLPQDPTIPNDQNAQVRREVLSIPVNQIIIDKDGKIYRQSDSAPNRSAPLGQIKLVEWNDAPKTPQEQGDMYEILKKYGFTLPRDNTLDLLKADPAQPDPAINADPTISQALKDKMNKRPAYEVMQGHLEESNVSLVNEMIMLMMTSKNYDMSQKLIAAEDKVLDKSINEMGRMQ